MQQVKAKYIVSVSEFKKNPNEHLKTAGSDPIAVLTNNRPSFYVLSPETYSQIAEHLFDLEIEPLLKRRLKDGSKSIKVDLDEL